MVGDLDQVDVEATRLLRNRKLRLGVALVLLFSFHPKLLWFYSLELLRLNYIFVIPNHDGKQMFNMQIVEKIPFEILEAFQNPEGYICLLVPSKGFSPDEEEDPLKTYRHNLLQSRCNKKKCV